MRSLLERFFKLDDHNTSIGSEVVAGATTFITMVYIILGLTNRI